MQQFGHGLAALFFAGCCVVAVVQGGWELGRGSPSIAIARDEHPVFYWLGIAILALVALWQTYELITGTWDVR